LSLLLILVAYFFDYKSSATTFAKDLINGILICVGLCVSAVVFVTLFNLALIHGVFYIGIELMLFFILKAFIQNK